MHAYTQCNIIFHTIIMWFFIFKLFSKYYVSCLIYPFNFLFWFSFHHLFHAPGLFLDLFNVVSRFNFVFLIIDNFNSKLYFPRCISSPIFISQRLYLFQQQFDFKSHLNGGILIIYFWLNMFKIVEYFFF